MQKGIRLNDGHVTYLGLLAKKDGSRRGCLSKKSSDNTKWHTKWFALLQNMLFYFENESSSRPSGLYLLEGCICDRAPSPKPSQSAKECLEKQVWSACARDHEHTRTHTGSLTHSIVFRLNVKILTSCNAECEICLCASNAFELYSSPEQSAVLMHIGCSRMMTSNPVQQHSTSSRIAVLYRYVIHTWH